MNTFKLFFHWPDGSVWSNLIASLIWATPSVTVIFRKIHKHHKRVEAKLELMHKDIKK